jgi:FixJ family two-component response regulator
VVAIIDDDPSVLRGLKRVLEASHFVTKVYDRGETFLDSDSISQVSCVVLDIHLGGISGIETRRRLKAIGSTIPVIFMTAHDSAAVRQEAVDAGCEAYLQKPFSGHVLVDAIRDATSGA